MNRNLIGGIKFKIIRTASSIIQFLAESNDGFLIRPAMRLNQNFSRPKHDLDQIGVVIQGPIYSIFDADNLAIFVRDLTGVLKPNAVVVSTWENEYTEYFSKLVPCKVIRSKDECFENNFQRQMFSTSVGLSFLKQQSIEISIKIRVDQRINLAALQLLKNLVLNKRYAGRIIFSSMNSYVHRFFGLSDMLNAGTTDDMMKYWSPDILSQYFDTSSACIQLPISTWVNDIRPHWFESFLNIRFAYLNGFNLTMDPWEDYVNYLSNWVVLIDAEILDQKWLKIHSPLYSLSERVIFNPSVASDDNEITQAIWFSICEGGYSPPRRKYDLKH